MRTVSLDKIARHLTLPVDDVPRLASLSYRHPNGFDKIVLSYHSLDRPVLRLHVWWADSATDRASDIHDHPWSFDSRIVRGCLVQEIWEPAAARDASGENFQASRIRLRQYPLPCAEVACGPVVAARRKLEHMEAGLIYSLSGHEFHRVYGMEESLTATLVLQYPVFRWFSTSWRSKDRQPTSLRGTSMNSSEYRLLLDRLTDEVT